MTYDTESRRLTAVGVIDDEELALWEERSSDPQFLRALRSLAALSHEAPIVDQYGYNRTYEGTSPFVVRDLMTSFQLTPRDSAGVAAVSIDDGRQGYIVQFDFGRGTAHVREATGGPDLKEAVLRFEAGRPLAIEVSLWDRQLVVGVNGQPLFETILPQGRPEGRATGPASPNCDRRVRRTV